jgi:aminoglycoside 3-N-acetyltransferase
MNKIKKNNYHYQFTDIENVLTKLKLKKDDSVFLSTSMGMLGIPNSKNKNHILTSSKWLLSSIKKIIGKNGNIFVPTYSYSFTKKNKRFNPKKTKAEIGYFPNFFLKQKNIVRSNDPMMSIAGFGHRAKEILLKASNNSFGKNCVLERLFKISNLKCCHVGLGHDWIPFLHYLDWKNKSPFRFDKIFSGSIEKNGKKKKN